VETQKGRSCRMTLLPWKREAPKPGPQTSAFEDLALPLLPALYNVAFWLTRNATRTVALEEELDEQSVAGSGLYPEGAIDRQTPEINLMRLADRAMLQGALEMLPPPLLEVILLCDVEEMKYKEIAVVLEVPIGTVMSRVARARTALRKTLQTQNAQTRERGA
jgi:RNA polymerase sigma-70 factor (ECF subfamily)